MSRQVSLPFPPVSSHSLDRVTFTIEEVWGGVSTRLRPSIDILLNSNMIGSFSASHTLKLHVILDRPEAGRNIHSLNTYLCSNECQWSV